jgi:hypothetical protein
MTAAWLHVREMNNSMPLNRHAQIDPGLHPELDPHLRDFEREQNN